MVFNLKTGSIWLAFAVSLGCMTEIKPNLTPTDIAVVSSLFGAVGTVAVILAIYARKSPNVIEDQLNTVIAQAPDVPTAVSQAEGIANQYIADRNGPAGDADPVGTLLSNWQKAANLSYGDAVDSMTFVGTNLKGFTLPAGYQDTLDYMIKNKIYSPAAAEDLMIQAQHNNGALPDVYTPTGNYNTGTGVAGSFYQDKYNTYFSYYQGDVASLSADEALQQLQAWRVKSQAAQAAFADDPTDPAKAAAAAEFAAQDQALQLQYIQQGGEDYKAIGLDV